MTLRIALLLLLTACGPVDLTVVSVEGRPCSDDSPCAAGEYCEKASCGATSGVCSKKEDLAACPENPELLCGCDGVEYWNDCYRKAAGAEGVLNQGPCRQAVARCNADNPCPTGATCFYRLEFPSQCGTQTFGRCVSFPSACPMGRDRQPLLSECAPQGARCLDPCAAAQTGRQVFPAMPGTCP